MRAQTETLVHQTQKEDMNYMKWLAYFLDLKPIEHVSESLCRRVSQITCPPRTVQELKIVLREIWDNIPPDTKSALVSKEITHLTQILKSVSFWPLTIFRGFLEMLQEVSFIFLFYDVVISV